MERSEPALVPEWLKMSASPSGGGSPSQADDVSATRVSKNKSSGQNLGRPSGLERTSSAYFRRGPSGNSSGKFRSYSGSGRNQRDREWGKDPHGSRDKDKFFLDERRHQEFFEPERNSLFSRFERDGLRRSQSMIPGKHGDTLPRKVVTDLNVVGKDNGDNSIPKVSMSSGANKTTFERDFPTLGSDEKAVLSDGGRVPYPGLTTAIQSLPICASTAVGEKWTSALAEVPALVGSNGSALSSALQVAPSTSKAVSLGASVGLNMAEALTLGPTRAQTAPQLSAGTQRREELAIRQSRQLIPVTPSMPKALATNLSDKSKAKASQALPNVISSASANHSPRGMFRNGDVSKSSNTGTFQFLKATRERNGVTSVMKDTTSPTSSSRVGSSAFPASSSVASRNQINNVDRKPIMTVLEKKPTSQAQSRNEFFNLVRKKSLVSSSSAVDSDASNSLSTVENSGNAESSFPDKHSEINAPPPVADNDAENDSKDDAVVTCNGGACNGQKPLVNGKEHPCPDPIIKEEEEAAFLRSLGWEENDEEGGLTEEEISTFREDFTKYIESNPPLRILHETQLTYLLLN